MWKLLLYINSIMCMPRNSCMFLSFNGTFSDTQKLHPFQFPKYSELYWGAKYKSCTTECSGYWRLSPYKRSFSCELHARGTATGHLSPCPSPEPVNLEWYYNHDYSLYSHSTWVGLASGPTCLVQVNTATLSWLIFPSTVDNDATLYLTTTLVTHTGHADGLSISGRFYRDT